MDRTKIRVMKMLANLRIDRNTITGGLYEPNLTRNIHNLR